jgi:hypothetical protein
VHGERVEDPWCLATNRSGLKASEIVELSGKRFTIEEAFRDTKDIHFGMRLKATHVGDSSRRDRLLLLRAAPIVSLFGKLTAASRIEGAMGPRLLALLGDAGERAGMDRMLEVSNLQSSPALAP